MKAHPILFSGPMVRALLDGSKTQTRRVIKPPRWAYQDDIYLFAGEPCVPDDDQTTYWINCPYGQPGDLLWVRETFSIYSGGCDRPDNIVEPWFPESRSEMPPPSQLDPSETSILYLADDQYDELLCYPSIYMPKWGSRLTLEITEVRAQRLQEISEQDARSEGCDNSLKPEISSRDMFAVLWDSINAKPKPCKSGGVITHYESFPWDDVSEIREHRGKPWRVFGNPWVRPITFKVHLQNLGSFIGERS